MPQAQMRRKWRVAVLVNIKDESLLQLPDLPSDVYAEFERIETVHLIGNAIERDGHETKLLLANKILPRTLEEYKPDICFNDAGGLQGDAREA